MTLTLACWFTWRISSFIFHILMFLIYLFSLIYAEVTKLHKKKEETVFNITGVDRRFMGRWKYLTTWNQMLQLSFWFICILVDIENWFSKVDSLNEFSYLKILSDYLFHTIIFPLSIFVTILYWGIKTLDKNLLVKSEPINATFISILIDHILHTVIAINCIAEFFLTYHKRPLWYINIFVPIGLLIFYVIFNSFIIYYKKFAVYDVLNISIWVTLLIILIAVLLESLTCLILTKLHYLYWTDNRISNFLFSPAAKQF